MNEDAPSDRRRAPKRPPRFHGPHTWALAKEQYLSGEAAKTVCERFGIGFNAFKRRMQVEGWTRRAYAAATDPARPRRRGAGVLAAAEPAQAPPAPPPDLSAAELARWTVRQAAQALGEGRTADARALSQMAESLSRTAAREPRTGLETMLRVLQDRAFQIELFRIAPTTPTTPTSPSNAPTGACPRMGSGEARCRTLLSAPGLPAAFQRRIRAFGGRPRRTWLASSIHDARPLKRVIKKELVETPSPASSWSAGGELVAVSGGEGKLELGKAQRHQGVRLGISSLDDDELGVEVRSGQVGKFPQSSFFQAARLARLSDRQRSACWARAERELGQNFSFDKALQPSWRG